MKPEVEIIDLCESEDEDPPSPSNFNSFPGENVIAECSLCTCCFNTTTAFIDHMTSYHRLGKLYECSQCHRFFMSEGALTHHMDTEHLASIGHLVSTERTVQTEHPVRQTGTYAGRGATRSFSCDICGDKFAFQEALEQHKIVHVVEKKYSVVADFENETPLDKKYACSICLKKFLVEKAMLMHKKRKHILLRIDRSKCNTFICKTCGRSFPGMKNLLIHESWHRRTSRKIKRQLRAVGLKGNIHTSLTLSKNLNCFKAWHEKTEMPVDESSAAYKSVEKVIGCDLCDRKFQTNRGLVNHSRWHSRMSAGARNLHHYKAWHRKNELPVGESATECLRSLTHKSVKKVVAKPKLKWYNCDLCDRKFPSRRGISVHYRWHARMSAASQGVSNSIPISEPTAKSINHKGNEVIENAKDGLISNPESYICKFCNKEFTYVFPYEQHVEKSHSTVKNLICQVCGECFEFQSSLDYHEMYQHSSKSLMFCSLCTRPFTNKISLKDHFKTCHQIYRKVKKEVQHLQSEEISSNGVQPHSDCSNRTTPKKLSPTVGITTQLNMVDQMSLKEVTSTSFTESPVTPKKTLSSRAATLRPTSVHFSVLPERMPHLLSRLYFSCNICRREYWREDKLIQHILLAHPSEEFPFSCDLQEPSPPLPPPPPQHINVQFLKSPSPECVPSENQIPPDRESEPVADFSLSHSVASESEIIVNPPSLSNSSSSGDRTMEEVSDRPAPPVSENVKTQSVDPNSDAYLLNLWEL